MNRTTNKCKGCGTKHRDQVASVLCCLTAPRPTGWCAWCGSDVEQGRSFCSPACSYQHKQDTMQSVF